MLSLGFALLFLFRLARRCEAYCEGYWQDKPVEDSSSYHIYSARTAQSSSDKDNELWLQAACPSQSGLSSCYFFGNESAEKAAKLERRTFIPHAYPSDPCLPFYPLDLLELFRNKRVIMLGDSMMGQIWSSIACTFYPLTPSFFSDLSWRSNAPSCTPISCPDPKSAAHSHLNSGTITIPAYNTSIKLMPTAKTSGFPFEFALAHYKMTKDDIMIVNWGLHYDDEGAYDRDMSQLHREYIESQEFYHYSHKEAQEGINQTLWKTKLPPVFFLQTNPQHSPKTENGYSNAMNFESSEGDADCKPIYKMNDWRNRIINKVFIPPIDDPNYPVRIIPTADGLYSQYDAHTGLAKFQDNALDCTHWCSPSGIFKFYHLRIYNTLYRYFQQTKADDKKPNHTEGVWYTFMARERDLIKTRSSSTIALLESRSKRVFQSTDAFNKLGFVLGQVKEVGIEEWDSIPEGLPIK